ncbi:MAG: flavin reductase, partial [Candidatus Acidiferrales bacterium]
EQTQEEAERLGVQFRRTAQGTALLEGALAQLECTLEASYLAGDHTIFVAQVESASVGEGQPLLFYRGRFCCFGNI